MIRKALPIAVTLLTWLATEPASASMVTVDASSYSPGTDISNVIPGVSLSALVNYSANPGSAQVVGISDVTTIACGATSGPNSPPPSCTPGSSLFTPLSPPAGAPSGIYPFFFEDPGVGTCIANQTLLTTCPYSSSLLKITLSNPTDYFQATWQTTNDVSGLFAVNSAGQLVAFCMDPAAGCTNVQTSSIPGGVKTGAVTLQTSSDDIAAVYVGGWTSTTGVDSFTYDKVVAVPEPGTMSLLGAALATIGFARRRRRT